VSSENNFTCVRGVCAGPNKKSRDSIRYADDELIVLSNCVGSVDFVIDNVVNLLDDKQFPTQLIKPIVEQVLDALELPLNFGLQRLKVFAEKPKLQRD
jgi:hypothetical protein